MNLRRLMFALTFVVLAPLGCGRRTPRVHEKLYISLETTDTVAVVDLGDVQGDQDPPGRVASAWPGGSAVAGQTVRRHLRWEES